MLSFDEIAVACDADCEFVNFTCSPGQRCAMVVASFGFETGNGGLMVAVVRGRGGHFLQSTVLCTYHVSTQLKSVAYTRHDPTSGGKVKIHTHKHVVRTHAPIRIVDGPGAEFVISENDIATCIESLNQIARVHADIHAVEEHVRPAARDGLGFGFEDAKHVSYTR